MIRPVYECVYIFFPLTIQKYYQVLTYLETYLLTGIHDIVCDKDYVLSKRQL